MSSNISNDTAILTLEVELVSTVKGEEITEGGAPPPFLSDVSDDTYQVVKDVVEESVEEAIGDALAEEGIDTDTVKNLTENFKDLDNKALGNLTKFATHPEGFLEHGFINVLQRAGPYGALAVAMLTFILGTPELTKAMVQMFGVKGGPLNQDFRYSQEEQLSQEFSRLMQFQRLTGDNPVIRFDNFGFVAVSDPDFEGNSLVNANEARSGRVGLRESAYGYIHGI